MNKNTAQRLALLWLRKLVWVCVVGVAGLLTACVPAKLPPQLEATPGMPVVIGERRVQTVLFSAVYPNGWRVITAPADEPPFVILAAPDNCAVIVLSADERPAPELSGCDAEETWVTSETVPGSPVVYAALRVAGDRDATEAAFRAVVGSVEPRAYGERTEQ